MNDGPSLIGFIRQVYQKFVGQSLEYIVHHMVKNNLWMNKMIYICHYLKFNLFVNDVTKKKFGLPLVQWN